MDDVAPALTIEELAEAVRDAPPPTRDDVSITWDGRRLDSSEKVLSSPSLTMLGRAGAPSGLPSHSSGEFSPSFRTERWEYAGRGR